jgi:hypothetical protein
MVEILWNSDAPHSPVEDHEMFELCLVDLGNAEKPSFLVREVHATWSASAQQIEWKGFQDKTFATPEDAQRLFANRRKFIFQAGFAYSTVLA